ncbi:MAG: recombination mediator RecR [Kiritimatiellia bacterium]|nr:recombination mediator RecR [Lentisphaerota bacterium]
MRRHAALERLCDCLGRLPGIGRRTAERLAFNLVTSHRPVLQDLQSALQEAAVRLAACSCCGGLTIAEENPCRLCTDQRRDDNVLCVVEDPLDIMRIEQAGGYHGRYHAIMGRLSPMGGVGAGDLRMAELLQRVEQGRFREVILALNSNVESDATAHFIASRLAGMDRSGMQVSRLAMGIPAGGGVANADMLTLASALRGRRTLER